MWHSTRTVGSISIGIVTTASGNPSSLGLSISEDASSSKQDGNYLKDTSKPNGDACQEDSTLKDADEMQWLDSPTGQNLSLAPSLELEFPRSPSEHDTPSVNQKRNLDISESDADEAPKAKVSYMIISMGHLLRPIL